MFTAEDLVDDVGLDRVLGLDEGKSRASCEEALWHLLGCLEREDERYVNAFNRAWQVLSLELFVYVVVVHVPTKEYNSQLTCLMCVTRIYYLLQEEWHDGLEGSDCGGEVAGGTLFLERCEASDFLERRSEEAKRLSAESREGPLAEGDSVL